MSAGKRRVSVKINQILCMVHVGLRSCVQNLHTLRYIKLEDISSNRRQKDLPVIETIVIKGAVYINIYGLQCTLYAYTWKMFWLLF